MTTFLNTDGAGTTAVAGPHQALAERLYPVQPPPLQATSPNAEVTAARANEAQARAMYRPENQYGHLNALAMATNPEGGADELARQRVEWGHIAADVGFDDNDIAKMAALVRQRAISPPTPEQIAAERRESIAALRDTYRGNFSEATAAAAALVRRDPRLHAYIAKTGLEANPWLVLRMAELARSSRNQLNLRKTT